MGIAFRDPHRNREAWILIAARAKKNLKNRIILLEEAFETKFKLLFRSVERFEQANRGRKFAGSRHSPVFGKTQRSQHDQCRIDRRGGNTQNAQNQQNKHHISTYPKSTAAS